MQRNWTTQPLEIQEQMLFPAGPLDQYTRAVGESQCVPSSALIWAYTAPERPDLTWLHFPAHWQPPGVSMIFSTSGLFIALDSRPLH